MPLFETEILHSEYNDSQEMHSNPSCSLQSKKFTPLQTRSFPQPVTVASLCPSMDLIALITSSKAHVHRTVTWQKLLTLSQGLWSNSSPADVSEQANCSQCLCWSPDGMYLAMGADDGTVTIYAVEDGEVWCTLKPDFDNNTDTFKGAESIEISTVSAFSPALTRSRAAKKAKETDLRSPADITSTTDRKIGVSGLVWLKMGNNAESAMMSEEELEEESLWRLRSHYLDRAGHFLPQNQKRSPDGTGSNFESDHQRAAWNNYLQAPQGNTSLNDHSSCTSPLSVLCLSYTSGESHLYLQGRYLIAKIPNTTQKGSTSPVEMTFTSDLTYLLFSPSLTMYTIPSLHTYRHSLQLLTATYHSITSHLNTASSTLQSVSQQWKDALHPLETKFVSLRKLLSNYGVCLNPRLAIRHYILEGSVHNNTSDAMNQFFGQMSEQSLTRISKTLHTGLHTVQNLIRDGICRNSKAISYEASQLYAMAKSDCLFSLFEPDTALDLWRKTELLCLISEQCFASLIEWTCRLRDLITWMVGVLAGVKAEGTATDSFDRENARKKRPSQAVLHRVISFLSEGAIDAGASTQLHLDSRQHDRKNSVATYNNETENVLGIFISDYFQKDQVHTHNKMPSFTNDSNTIDFESSIEIDQHQLHKLTSPSIKMALKIIKDSAGILFQQPCEYINSTIKRTNIVFAPSWNQNDSLPSIHKRVSTISKHNTRNTVKNNATAQKYSQGFQPNTHPKMKTKNRHWLFLASKILITERKRQYIHLLAIPGLLPKAKKTEENARDRPDHHETPFFLQTTIQLPPYWILKDIIFYGDDGNSSRISSTASAGAAEGRQNLFLLVVPDATQNYHVEKGTELWVLNYESVHWSLQTYAEGTDIQVNRSGDQLKVAAEVVLEKENKDIAEHHDGRIFLFPKRRKLEQMDFKYQVTHDEDDVDDNEATEKTRRLFVSGPRGVGGVISKDRHLLSLFDLEEDEEYDEDEDDYDDDDEEHDIVTDETLHEDGDSDVDGSHVGIDDTRSR